MKISSISSLCEPGLKRSANQAFKRLDTELQQIVLDNLDSICFGRKDEFYDNSGKFKVVIHWTEWQFLPKQAKLGKMMLSINEILLALHPPSKKKPWSFAEDYWKKSLPEIKFLMLCIRYLTLTNLPVDWVQNLTMEAMGEINVSTAG